jgi:N-acetylneuraminate synthase/N,N'-diacetyllegionaminate synthase
MQEITIGRFTVGHGHPALIMVDAGVNHNNSIVRGIEIVDQAVASGANVVKFQTYKAKMITTKSAPRYWSSKLDTDSGGTQYETFARLDGMGVEGYQEFKKRCVEKGVVFSSTPFNLPDVELLEQTGMDVYKISSSDIIYLDLIAAAGHTGKPVIISTGCASIGEIEKAVEAVRRTGNEQVILQHCILQYPCEDANANLARMRKIQDVFPEIPVGYSDHTYGTIVPAAAVALGARTIEKHFTIDKKLPDSPDHPFSADPGELKEMTTQIRRIEAAIGIFANGHYPAEEKAWKYARKSLVSTCHIPRGTRITAEMLTCKRPGTGIYPEFMDFVVGAAARVDIPEDTTLTREMLG